MNRTNETLYTDQPIPLARRGQPELPARDPRLHGPLREGRVLVLADVQPERRAGCCFVRWRSKDSRAIFRFRP